MNASAAFLRKRTNSDQVRGRSKSEESVIDRWSASQLMGFFRTRSPQAASRSDRSFGSSAQGPARPFATAGWSISRSARFFFIDPAPTEIYTRTDTLSLHDALPHQHV